MTANPRKWDRKRWLWFTVLLICMPVLMGFYSWSCLTPVYGIFPSACDPKEPGCQAAMMDAGIPDGDPNDLTEKLLAEAQASSAFSLNAWSRELELCFEFKDPDPAQDVYLVDNPSLPGVADPFFDCLIGEDIVPQCFCYHFFRNGNPAHPFNMWLEKFVQYKQCANSADGRSGLIQIGPIFTWGRAVPAYLHDVPFNDVEMIQAFARLWDDMSVVLAQAKLTLPPNEFPRTPEWIISIGNEINFYLDNPNAINIIVDGAGPFATPEQQVEAAWTKYSAFYQKASDYVRGLDVDITGDGVDDPNTSARPFTWVTFSTTWSSSPNPSFPHCSPGWALANPGCPQTPDGVVIGKYKSMLAISSFASYTYYPYPFGAAPPETVGLNADFFRFVVSMDLDGMEEVSQIVAPMAGRQLPIVLQEVGYPSSWVNPNLPIDAGAYNSDNIADQQEAFVQGAIEALRAHNGKWDPELAWWADFFFTPPPDPSQSPFGAPRIVSYNAFMLHDFWGELPGTCPFEKFDPDPMLNDIAPTQLGVFLCSLGLRTEAAAEKDAGGGKTPWRTFVQQATLITDAGLDPDRSCP